MTRQGLAIALGNGLNFDSFQFTFNDLKATSGSGAKAIDLFDMLSGPPYNTTTPFKFTRGSVILKIRVKTSVAFSGGTLSAMTASLGKSGSATLFTSAYDIFQAVADGTLQETATPAMGTIADITPIVTFTPTGDACANCTAGVLNIDVLWADVTTPTANVL